MWAETENCEPKERSIIFETLMNTRIWKFSCSDYSTAIEVENECNVNRSVFQSFITEIQ